MKRFLGILLWVAWSLHATAQVNFTESSLPIVVILTANAQEIPDEPKIPANMGIIYNGPGQVNRLSDPWNEFQGTVGIERRGATSQQLFPKFPYAIELRDASGDDISAPLLGMPKESDWALISNYNDKSLIRDALAYTLAGSVMSYAPRCRFVEVVINNQYQGIYLLTERIKRDNNRVDLKKNDPAKDPSGGYILKLDKEEGDSVIGYWTSHVKPYHSDQQIRFLYHYPRTEDLVPAQKQYLQNWMYTLEENLRSPGFAHPATGYRKYLDPATFIDFMWVNEAAKNIDGYRLSTFFYKDRDSIDGRLKMGPVWDFNLAFGNCNYCSGETTYGWMWDFNQVCGQDYWVIPFWWERLRQDTNFLIEAQQRWKNLRAGPLSDQNVEFRIDSLAAVLAGGPRSRNFQRWPVLGEWVWPNNFVGATYEQELDYLKDWLRERLHWMDNATMGLYTGTYQPAGFFAPRVLPNPARGATRIEFYAEAGAQISGVLYDVQGHEIKRFTESVKAHNKQSYDLTLPAAAGVYFLQLDLEKQRYLRQVVVH